MISSRIAYIEVPEDPEAVFRRLVEKTFDRSFASLQFEIQELERRDLESGPELMELV